MKPSTEWWRYLAPLAVIAIIALLPLPAGLESHTWLYFAVFTGVIVGLILEPVPGAALAMPEIPLPVFCLMVGAAIGLGSILTPYATGPSPIYYGSGYLPTVDYWRLGAIFGLIFLVLLVITGLLWMPMVLL